MKYLVNETWVFATRKQADRQARNLASACYQANRNLGKTHAQAREAAAIWVRPITEQEAQEFPAR